MDISVQNAILTEQIVLFAQDLFELFQIVNVKRDITKIKTQKCAKNVDQNVVLV